MHSSIKARLSSKMKAILAFGVILSIASAALSQILEDQQPLDLEAADEIDDRAAPWWEQQEEAAKRRCQSSCTMHSKGVKSQITLCDDTDVSRI